MKNPYKFRFYRCITNDCGKQFNSTIDTIHIRHAKTPERARQAAVQRFMRRQNLARWDCLATGYELLKAQDRQ